MDCQHSRLAVTGQGVTGQTFPMPGKGKVASNSVTMSDINCFQLKRLHLDKKANCFVLGGEKTNCVLKQASS